MSRSKRSKKPLGQPGIMVSKKSERKVHRKAVIAADKIIKAGQKPKILSNKGLVNRLKTASSNKTAQERVKKKYGIRTLDHTPKNVKKAVKQMKKPAPPIIRHDESVVQKIIKKFRKKK